MSFVWFVLLWPSYFIVLSNITNKEYFIHISCHVLMSPAFPNRVTVFNGSGILAKGGPLGRGVKVANL